MVLGVLIMDIKKIYYAAHNAIGDIVGLYNSADHKLPNIPQPHIKITPSQHESIVRRPMDFSVNTSTGTLLDSKASLAAVEADSIEPHAGQLAVAKGFTHNGICYYADDVASAHITQCLAISALDKTYEAKLKSIADGEVKYRKVTGSALLEIAKGVNALRLKR